MDLFGLTTRESFAEIDAELARLDRKIRTLRNLRNTLPPISSLPNEILAKIFLTCHSLDVESNSTDAVRQTPQGTTRLVVSWVSQQWRHTALSEPNLWTFLTKGSIDYMRSCLRRSTGLHVTIDLVNPRRPHLQECVVAFPRLCSLHVDPTGTAISGAWEDANPNGFWDQPAPHLISLSLNNMDLERKGRNPHGPLFAAVHPRLRHLMLSHCHFRWDLPLLSAPTLTTLSICEPNNRILVGVLVEALRNMASLTDLKFDICIISKPPSNESKISPVHLPNLRTLSIRHVRLTFNRAVYLLSHLDTPNSSINLEIVGHVPHTQDLRDVFQIFRTYWDEAPYWKDQDIRHMELECPGFSFNLTMSTLMRTSSGENQESPQFTFSMKAGYCEYHLDSLSQLFSFPKCNPHSIYLNHVSRNVVYALARFTDPRHLRLDSLKPQRGSGACISETMHKSDDQADSTFSLDRFFPSLETLEADGECYGSFREYHSSAMENLNVDEDEDSFIHIFEY